jgi:hypothetical protein
MCRLCWSDGRCGAFGAEMGRRANMGSQYQAEGQGLMTSPFYASLQVARCARRVHGAPRSFSPR